MQHRKIAGHRRRSDQHCMNGDRRRISGRDMKATSSKDVSIVIQGGLTTDLRAVSNCIRSARESFPDSEIVVSTFDVWAPKEDKLAAIGADRVVVSKDPGPLKSGNSGRIDNTNRMIASSFAGLINCSRPIALKLRSDSIVTHGNIIPLWDEVRHFDSKFHRSGKVFKSRIIASSIFSRRYYNPEVLSPYHVSDWQFFGWTDDILRYFDRKPLDERGYSSYFPDGHATLFKHDFTSLSARTFRMAPEAAILSDLAAEHGGPEYRDVESATEEVIDHADDFVRGNFAFLDPFTYGVLTTKYLLPCLNIAGAVEMNEFGWNDPSCHPVTARKSMHPWSSSSFTQRLTRLMRPVRRAYWKNGDPRRFSVGRVFYALLRRTCMVLIIIRFGARIARLSKRRIG